MLKTESIKRSTKEYFFYNTVTGIYNYKKVILKFFDLIIISLILKFLIIVYFDNFNHLDINNIGEYFLFVLKKIPFLYTHVFIDINFIKQKIFQLFFIIDIYLLIYVFLSLYMYKQSRLQLMLSNLGLENYKVKKIKNGYIFRLKHGEEVDFDYVLNIKEDIRQVFKIKQDIYMSRHRKRDVKIEYKKEFSTTILEHIDIYNKLQPDKFYLGFKRVNNKLLDNYIMLEDFQRVSITGTSGAGKSNLINLILYNLLFNIDKVEQIIFCDFKGGLESEPLMRVANKYELNIIVCADLKSLYSILQNISKTNDERMEYNRVSSLKKYNGKAIYLIYDEFAQIGLYNATSKEEKELHKSIMSIYSRLHATGRSQRVFSITITQSFLQNSSGIPSDVKTNLDTNIMLKTDNNQSIQSVFSADELEDAGLNPKTLDVGEYILKSNGQLVECKAIYVPANVEKYFDSIIYKNMQKYIDNKLFLEPPKHSKFMECFYDVFNFYKTNKYYSIIRYLYKYQQKEHQFEKEYFENRYKK